MEETDCTDLNKDSRQNFLISLNLKHARSHIMKCQRVHRNLLGLKHYIHGCIVLYSKIISFDG